MSLERVDVADFLSGLGVVVEGRSGENLLFKCPWHNDSNPSARMNVNTTAWLCSVGCGQGNAIHFLAKLRELSFDEAQNLIHSRYGIGPGAPIDDLEAEVRRNLSSNVVVAKQRVLPDEGWIEYLRLDWEVDRQHPAVEYMRGRGFSPNTLGSWGIGYDELSHRVTIPVRDHEGTLVGFKARAIDPDRQPRYMVLGDNRPDQQRYGFSTYAKSQYVFGLNYVPPECRECWIVEGELNAIAMMSRHATIAVAVAGSDFSDRQRELIARHFDLVTVYFDNDLAGNRGTAKVVASLMPFINVDVVIDAPGDAAEISPDAFKQLTVVPAMHLILTDQLDVVLQT